MPCDSIILNKVELALADKALVILALKRMKATDIREYEKSIMFTRGYERYKIYDGKLECRQGQEKVADEIKRNYSREVVERTAKKYGWTIKQDARNVNKFQIIKRYQ